MCNHNFHYLGSIDHNVVGGDLPKGIARWCRHCGILEVRQYKRDNPNVQGAFATFEDLTLLIKTLTPDLTYVIKNLTPETTMKAIFEVFNGGTDGRDSYSIGFFAKEDAAVTASKGQGAMGCGDGEIRKHILYESFEDYKKNNPKARRDAALAKLTLEDRMALGLS